MSAADTPLEQRVARTIADLSEAGSVPAAMTALSFADFGTLRAIEPVFGRHEAGDECELRERLARQFLLVRKGRGARVSGTGKITVQRFAQWARDTLLDRLPGWTDWDNELGGQFRITALAGPQPGDVIYEVRTLTGDDPRRFRFTVAAEPA